MKKLFGLVLSLFLLPCMLHSQALGTGAYAFASFDKPGLDSINLGNLNTRFTIPIVNRHGRGQSFSYNLQYEGLIWTNANGVWVPDPTWGFRGMLNGSGFTGYLTYTDYWNTCPGPSGNHGGYDDTYGNFVYHDAFGGQHSFDYSIDFHDCPEDDGVQVVSGSGASFDGSGYTMLDMATIKSRSGTTIRPSYSANGGYTMSLTDSNGNQITGPGNGTYVDTLGVTALTVAGSSPKTFTYPVSLQSNNASTATASLSYQTYTVRTNFGCSGVSEYGSTQVSLPYRMTLADSSYYEFSYESTYQATDGAVTGRLGSIRLPTGGTIQYSYQNGCSGAGMNVDGTVGSLTRTTSDGIRSYGRAPLNGNSTSTTLQDEKGNQTLLSFTIDLGTQNFYETHRTVHQGPLSQAALLDVFTCYNGTAAPCDSSAIALPISEVDITSSNNGGSQAVAKKYYEANGALLTQSDIYVGASLLNRTQTSYNALGEPLSINKYDQNGSPYASTSYGYDETGLTATSGIPQHTTVSGQRGNLTSIHVTGSPNINTYTAYYDTGMPNSITAVDGGVTTYTYDGTGAFIQGKGLPSGGVTLSTSAQYDAYSAALLNSTGFNGETTAISQYDSFMRATSASLPDSSTVGVAYDSPTQVTSIRPIDSSNTATSKTLLDGYGRLQRTAIQASSSIWYLTDYCYDGVGLLQYQSTPYSANGYIGPLQCSSSTGDSYSYDALGRVLSLSHADGSSVSHIYISRAAQTSTSAGVSRIKQYDPLGRISAVCEISANSSMPASGSPVSCGMDIAGTGFVTQYSYDAANHTTTINQGGQQRIFSTDAAGRPTYSFEPERGTTNYTYSYNGTGLVTVRVRPQANQTGSVTTTTTTQYDQLGRVISVTYSDGTPTKHFVYDQASNWNGTSLGFSKGKLTYAYTENSTANPLAGNQFTYDSLGRVSLIESCLPAWCGNASYDDRRAYTYNGLNQPKTETYDTHNGTIPINYSYNLAGQLTQVSGGQDDATAYAPMWDVRQIGAFGPTAIQLGSGLVDVKSYTAVGQRNGSWTCANGSQNQYCDNGPTSFYAYADFSNGQVGWRCDTTAATGCDNFSYDEFGRLTDDYSFGTHIAQYTYDRWGNRTAQQSFTTGYSPGFIYNTGTNGISGLPYDAAGNLQSEGWSQFQYDAEGNLTSVNAGSSTSSSYIYDAFNRRVITDVAGTIERYGYDLSGRRAITWNGGGPFLKAVQYYAGDSPIAYWTASDSHIHFQHQDWLGTEKIRTSNTGATEATFTTLAYGELAASSGTDTNRDHYAGMEYDSESGTSHATYRQYINGQGRWMSPDPYDGSYNWTNPQSLNRYSYVQNSPHSYTDPTGLARETCITYTYSNSFDLSVECIEDGGGGGGGGGGGMIYLPGYGTPPQEAPSDGDTPSESPTTPPKWPLDKQKCAALANKINNILEQIAKRQDDLNRNPMELYYSLAGTKPLYAGDVEGHQKLLGKYIQDLANASNDYNDRCGGGEPPTPAGKNSPVMPPIMVPPIMPVIPFAPLVPVPQFPSVVIWEPVPFSPVLVF